MSKPVDLFPFRGEMVSAYQIAKAYGIAERSQSFKRRLLSGMSVEEAVEDVRRLNIKRHDMKDGAGGIRPREIERMREAVKIGQKMRVRICSSNNADIEPMIHWETCTVTGIYPHVVTLRRPCGVITSKTYVELILEGLKR